MKLLLSLLLLSFSRASAAGFSSIQVNELGTFINNFNSNVVAVVGVLLMSLAIIAFFAGLVRFIWSIKEGEAKKADEGKKFMLWSLLAIFIIFSLYGIIYFMQQTLGIKGVTTIAKPCLNLVTDCKGSLMGLPTTQTVPNVSGDASAQTTASACLGKVGNGASCVLNGSAGTCQVVSGNFICIPSSGTPFGGSGDCDSLALTSVCTTNTGVRGTCQMVGSTRFCVGDISNTSGNDNVTCTYADIGRVCENGKGVCKSGQNGAYCDIQAGGDIPCTVKMGGTCRINGMSGSCSDFTCVTSSQSSNNSGVSATNNDCKASTINDGCKTPSGRDGFCATDPDGSGYYCQSDTSATSAVIPSVNTNKCAENTVCYDGAGFEGKCTNGDCVFPKGVRYDNDPNACSESCSKTCVDVTPQGGQRGCGINGCWLCPA